VTVLGSGSRGNATLLVSTGGRLLVDIGLSYRETVRRLESLGVSPDSIDAILLTHAHQDHVRGVGRFVARHGTPVHMTPATRAACGGLGEPFCWRPLEVGVPVEVAGVVVRPFRVPHDAVETLAFRFETPEGAVGFATDLGTVTGELVEQCRGCRLLVLEANHARDLLRLSPYRAAVKARIGGAAGHLSNEALAAFVEQHLDATVQALVLAHLSRVNNVPELAALSCREALTRRGRPEVRVVVARQDRVAETLDLAELG
jgi:phosphoribosyl 1,2-cyclic phosphodiesterase